MAADGTDANQFADALRSTGRFVYGNSHTLTLVSVCWFLASVPVVTIGPATLGAYVAVRQLDSDRNRVELNELLGTVRSQFVPATLYGLVPPLFFVIAAGYAVAHLSNPGLLTTGLFFVSLYVGLYAGLVMVPTFYELADGTAPAKAIKLGIRWTAAHPTLALLTGLVTLIVLLATLLLTIGFVLLYPMLAFSFQHRMVTEANAA
ncbi:hypothetical protein CV102_15845 [Natronococcus pandeyae]|uniref:Uncharacterized protein n=1 Tax=Natronococcus pandeyae TaxID=2055836 RepID=A0A8J8TPJ0_9EURY|nr:DUF624 domain-containing protein [Natronococcus pandeyae]TYL37806.1 hypothetical protein CV102_15845 [Natronococcus pandeyae]